MSFHASIRSTLVLLALLVPASVPGAQEAGANPVNNLRESSPFRNQARAELVLEQYPVQNVRPEELLVLVQTMTKRAGRGDTPPPLLLGTKIVIYDTKEEVQRTLELLQRLDEPLAPSRKPAPIEYRPRFLSLNTAFQAVKELSDLSIVQERGLLVLHDSPDSTEAALALLERLDLPAQQVLLTCQLLEVGGSAQGPALPRELGDNLQKLLPGSTFAPVAMAMLQTSVGGEARVSLQLESTGKRYRFELVPSAFDASTGSLTVTDCSLIEEADKPRELFRTSTVLHGGEYTVLAATGATPRLLVVRVVPQ